MKSVIEIPQKELVYIRGEKPVTTSLKIAEVFGKEHKNIIRLIRIKSHNYSKSFAALNFELSEYQDESGKRNSMYELTKDGFLVVVLGLTGNVAAKFQEAFIIEFNRRGELLQKMVQKMMFMPAPKRKNLHGFGFHRLESTPDGKTRHTWVSGAKTIEEMDDIEYHSWIQSKRAKNGMGQIKALINDLPDFEKYQSKYVDLLDHLEVIVEELQVKQLSPKLAQKLLFEESA